MRQDLDDALVRDFPLLYASRNDPMSCMGYGFSCGDGWEPLIRRMSATLEAEIAKQPDPSLYRAEQVKEKFGLVRVYMSSSTPEMEAAIAAAELESSNACESCGKPGFMRNVGWWRHVSCDVCELKWGRR